MNNKPVNNSTALNWLYDQLRRVLLAAEKDEVRRISFLFVPETSGNFRLVPGISGNFLEFPKISGNFRAVP